MPSVVFNGIYEEGHYLLISGRGSSVSSVIREGVVLLKLRNLRFLRVLPLRVTILPINFYGLVMVLGDHETVLVYRYSPV